MLCLSFYEWRCIDAGEHMILAPFLEKTSRDRAPGRFADFLFAPKHAKADMLLTKSMGPLRLGAATAHRSFHEYSIALEGRRESHAWLGFAESRGWMEPDSGSKPRSIEISGGKAVVKPRYRGTISELFP